MVNYSTDDRFYHIGVRKGEVGRYVILPGDPKRTDKIAEKLDDVRLMGDNREFRTWTGTLLGEKVSVTSTGIGGPSAAIAMEELVLAGADTFIRVGTCGGIELDVLGGDLVIATGAVRMEGTSKEYAPIEYPAVSHIDIVNALKYAAEKLGQPFHIGVVESKDSFYGEHEPEKMPVSYELLNKWEAWKRMHCLASEMESAALMIVAEYLGVRMGTILRALGNQERETLGMENVLFHDANTAIDVAIEAMKKLIIDDRK